MAVLARPRRLGPPVPLTEPAPSGGRTAALARRLRALGWPSWRATSFTSPKVHRPPEQDRRSGWRPARHVESAYAREPNERLRAPSQSGDSADDSTAPLRLIEGSAIHSGRTAGPHESSSTRLACAPDTRCAREEGEGACCLHGTGVPWAEVGGRGRRRWRAPSGPAGEPAARPTGAGTTRTAEPQGRPPMGGADSGVTVPEEPYMGPLRSR